MWVQLDVTTSAGLEVANGYIVWAGFSIILGVMLMAFKLLNFRWTVIGIHYIK
jgi:hypothetical protein